MSKKTICEPINIKLVTLIKGDHRALYAELKYHCRKRGPGYWKLNNKYLSDDSFVNGIANVVSENEKEYSQLKSKRLLWEIIKINIKAYAIKFSKKMKHNDCKKQTELQQKLDLISEQIETDGSNDTDKKANLLKEKKELETELNKFYVEKANGIQIRARAKWTEEGEKSTSYFLRLENQRQGFNTVNKIQDKEGKTHSDDTSILNVFSEFYNN